MIKFLAFLGVAFAVAYACNNFGQPIPPTPYCPPCTPGTYPGYLPGSTVCSCLSCTANPYNCSAGTWDAAACRCRCTNICAANYYPNQQAQCACQCNIAFCANRVPVSANCTC